MKTILYATDYSRNSLAALQYAENMATTLQVRLVLTHVYDVPTVLGTQLTETFPNLSKDARRNERSKLQRFYEEHKSRQINEPTPLFEPIEYLSVTKGIISKVTEWHAHMIVVGVKGESRLREMIIGSTTKALIDDAPCIVMAIPGDASHMSLKTIVYATDFEEEDLHAIQKLTDLAKPFNAKIKVVHIITKKEYTGEARMEWFKELLKKKVGYSNMEFDLVFSDDVFNALRIYIGDVNGDIIAMLERKKAGMFKKLLHRDLVKKMESYGRIPLISFNEHNLQTLYF